MFSKNEVKKKNSVFSIRKKYGSLCSTSIFLSFLILAEPTDVDSIEAPTFR